ncbi:M23 family metallopeptidase [Uliginosibacterium sp. 31-16]|uniref:M23 family metallopeptidase n=1 Tax=Uliginosibacterium sp. 31-16 TaxID=3068315 RepID=UPI00273F1C7A|nr:M23 family metallopeptidase [Uliginosibacterium sp. 31-16]MDP5239459.1 M23 family metallopeptidase [Uliginosibacterium sp. 31-16]
MAFILHTTRSISRSGVRMLSLRQLILAGISGGILLVLLAFGAGVIAGQYLKAGQGSDLPVTHADPAKERFTFDRLGEMAGRLVKLETDARSLVKKLSALEALESQLGKLNAGKPVTAGSPVVSSPSLSGAAGGRVLAPQGCSSDEIKNGSVEGQKIDSTEKSLVCLQELLGRVEAAASRRSVAYMAIPTQQPVDATRIGSPFGNRADPFNGHLAFHSGIDFDASTGTPIRSAGGGRVKTAAWVSDLGFVVEIEHGNGLMTRYAHTSKMYVKAGDIVTPGQLIAAVGSTGRSTGPHLHFEILHNGRFVDPMHYLSIGALQPNA